MRRTTLGLATTLIVVACGQATPDPASTTTVFVAPTTTQLVTTTTVVTERVDICSRGLLWEVGSIYGAGCFIVPLSFEPDEEGWRSGGGGNNWVRIDWRETGGDVAIRMAALAYEPQSDPASVLDQIIAIDGVNAQGISRGVSVGTHSATTVDVHTDPDPQPEVLDFDECSSDQGLVTWGYDVWPGYPLVYDPQSSTEEFGLGACATFRIWAVDMDGTTVTILATTEEQARFEELMPTVERLLESMSVGASQ